MYQFPSSTMDPFDGWEEMLAQWNRGIRPALDFLVSQWADGEPGRPGRVLDKPFTKVKQNWDTNVVPYTREIMDCLSARSPVKRVAWMKSAQVAGSETGNNWLGYVIEQAPGMMMLVNPTKAMWEVSRGALGPVQVLDQGGTYTYKLYPCDVTVRGVHRHSLVRMAAEPPSAGAR